MSRVRKIIGGPATPIGGKPSPPTRPSPIPLSPSATTRVAPPSPPLKRGSFSSLFDPGFTAVHIKAAIDTHASEGSALRRYLIYRLSDGVLPTNPDTFMKGILYAIEHRIIRDYLQNDIENASQLMRNAPYTFGELVPQLIKFIEALKPKGLAGIVWSFRYQNPLNTFKKYVARFNPAVPSSDRIIAQVSPHAYGTNERIAALNDLLNQQILGNRDISKMKVAVVGYGMNLDLISIFLSLGCEVTAVEKWELGNTPSTERPSTHSSESASFSREIGLQEVCFHQPRSPQFSPQEIRNAFTNNSHLHILDADSLEFNTQRGTFDLVVASGLVNQAISTTAMLVKRGGYVLADAFEGDHYPTGTQFVEVARQQRILFQSIYEGCFKSNQPTLASNFTGFHYTYLLQR